MFVPSYNAKSFRLVFALLCVFLATGAMEICRHADGHAHLFLAMGHCHGHSSESSDGCAGALPVPHGEAPSDPCEHDSLTLENEWIPAGARMSLAPPALEGVDHDGHAFAHFLRADPPPHPLSAFPRGPPAPGAGSRNFLKTTRLLI